MTPAEIASLNRYRARRGLRRWLSLGCGTTAFILATAAYWTALNLGGFL